MTYSARTIIVSSSPGGAGRRGGGEGEEGGGGEFFLTEPSKAAWCLQGGCWAQRKVTVKFLALWAQSRLWCLPREATRGNRFWISQDFCSRGRWGTWGPRGQEEGPVGGPLPPGVFSGLQCPHCAIRKVRGAFPVGTAN